MNLRKLQKNWKSFILPGLVFLVAAMILFLSLRGLSGIPTVKELNTPKWSFDGPLELSPERGRFALLYSIVEDHSLTFSVSVARLAVPDLAITSMGKYVSLFAPGVSFLVVPGYVIGKYFGISQVGAYAVIALFALMNMFLIASIVRRLSGKWYAGVLAGATFLFASPAFAYGVSLYQHHVSVSLLLISLWALLAFRNIWSLAIVWFACAASIVVDNPNLFLMFPVGFYALVRLFEIVREKKTAQVKGFGFGVLTFAGFLIPLVFFGWYNYSAYGNMFQLPGTLEGVAEIDAYGNPKKESTYQKEVLTQEQLASLRGKKGDKTAVGFFKTRNLYNGFYVHFLSPDRGVFAFTPVILLGIFGLVLLYRKHGKIVALFTAVIGVNVLLYSMWGDPWGGWAFGSRYLIPTYAILAIGLGFALSQWNKKWWFVGLFAILFIYSSGVNTLGAITSMANPPKVQVLAMEKQSGHEEKYTYFRNWEFLDSKYGSPIGSKSFLYDVWFKGVLTPRQYFVLVYGMVLVLAMGALVINSMEREKK